MMLNMSLADVANKLGVTLQQIQKYEKGISEIAASRLEHIGHILQIPVGFFFEDESTDEPGKRLQQPISMDSSQRKRGSLWPKHS
jgi:transcriptional regulator with XRE-family HTH domain